MRSTLLLLTAVAALGQSIEPRIVIESAAEYGTTAPLVFRFEGLSAAYNPYVAWFVPDAGWFPFCGNIAASGIGRFAVYPLYASHTAWATKIFIANLPVGTFKPCGTGFEALPDAIANAAVRLLYQRVNPYGRKVQFSGRTWNVKGLTGLAVGPGPNQFSPTAQNVFLDSEGRLHLRITPCSGGNGWCSAEVVLNESLGYGEYRFVLDMPLVNLHPNAVLGMFTWSEDRAWNHREIDIEISRWRIPTNPNAQFVVQPYWNPGNLLRFNAPIVPPSTSWTFDWAPHSVEFEARADTDLIQQYSYTQASGIPPPGNERVRINLYWASGQPGGTEQEVIIRSFTFAPSTRLRVGSGTLDLQQIPATGIPNQRLRVDQPVWTFQTPLPTAFQPYPESGTMDTDVWFTLHPNWQPRDRTFMARAGAGTVNFHQLGSTGTTEQRMVGMLYYNFFARVGAPEEIDFQVIQALHKGLATGALAANLFQSQEFNDNGRFAAGLYFGLLCRAPEYQGWRFQTRALVTRIVTQADLIRNFLDSAEYRLNHGTPSDAEFVRSLYRCVLLREPALLEVNLQAAETARVGRVEIARRFLNSAEFRITSGPEIAAFLLYATMLNREGKTEERQGWASAIRNGMTLRSAIEGFAASPEFPLAFH